jgi:hypothetical protein
MYVKPLSGRQVPDPQHGDILPPEGRNVTDDQYWQRRILDGDVAEAEDPNGVKPAVVEKAATK